MIRKILHGGGGDTFYLKREGISDINTVHPEFLFPSFSHTIQLQTTINRVKTFSPKLLLPNNTMAAAAAAARSINVVAICGSLRKASYNRGLVRAGIYDYYNL